MNRLLDRVLTLRDTSTALRKATASLDELAKDAELERMRSAARWLRGKAHDGRDLAQVLAELAEDLLVLEERQP